MLRNKKGRPVVDMAPEDIAEAKDKAKEDIGKYTVAADPIPTEEAAAAPFLDDKPAQKAQPAEPAKEVADEAA